VTIDKGTLELGESGGAGSGAITFAKAADATLQVDNDVYALNAIKGFSTGDTVDFTGAGSVALAGPAGGGAIDFSAIGGDEAHLNGGKTLGATITNFRAGDEVDFEAVHRHRD